MSVAAVTATEKAVLPIVLPLPTVTVSEETLILTKLPALWNVACGDIAPNVHVRSVYWYITFCNKLELDPVDEFISKLSSPKRASL